MTATLLMRDSLSRFLGTAGLPVATGRWWFSCVVKRVRVKRVQVERVERVERVEQVEQVEQVERCTRIGRA
ncbi:hypothetical protein ACIPLC_02810 [Kitasatospora sp. NPDC086801]|uniref:hypothetical protein n=1 Tax=Kitasatospora sp. NPDC086801 TaxID=3364066 RepID=UPI00380E4FE9